MMSKRIFLFLLAVLVGTFQQAVAQESRIIGLSSNYSVVQVNNLPIDSTISMAKLVNFPLIVTNGSSKPLNITMKPILPKKIQSGFEAIPDVSWIVPEKEFITVPAKGQASMDVFIKIPNDKKLFNKKYHVGIHVSVAKENLKHNAVVFDLSLTGKLLFSIAPKPNKKALEYAMENPADAAFAFVPNRLDLYDVKAGESFDVADKLGKPLYLENKSSKNQTYYLSMIPVKQTEQRIDAKSQTNMTPDDVELNVDELKIRSQKKSAIDLRVNVPKQVDFKKGKIVYILSCQSGQAKGIERQLAIYCSAETKVEAEKKMDMPQKEKQDKK
jgi:hypothetical protein